MKLYIFGQHFFVMQVKRKTIKVGFKAPLVKVLPKAKAVSAARLEAQRLQKTFANLRAKGVLEREIKYLVELKKKADNLSREADSLTRKKDPGAKVANAEAASAVEFFYQNLLRHIK